MSDRCLFSYSSDVWQLLSDDEALLRPQHLRRQYTHCFTALGIRTGGGKKKNITKPNLPHAKTNVSSNKPTTSKANNFLPLTFNRHKPGLWFL